MGRPYGWEGGAEARFMANLSRPCPRAGPFSTMLKIPDLGGRFTEPHPALAGEDLRFLKMSTKKALVFSGRQTPEASSDTGAIHHNPF